jgi:hypothetical protein
MRIRWIRWHHDRLHIFNCVVGLAQISDKLPAAGFPLVRHLGHYTLTDRRFSGGLYELQGQVFRPLRRKFPPVRDAEQIFPLKSTVSPGSIRRGRFNRLSECSQPSFTTKESKNAINLVCCIIQPEYGRKAPEAVRLPQPFIPSSSLLRQVHLVTMLCTAARL